MIVRCSSLDEFLAELDRVRGRGNEVYEDTVRIGISDQPLTDRPSQTKRDSVKHEIVLYAGMVVRPKDGSEYLVQCAEFCGLDYHDASQELVASERAVMMKNRVIESCKTWGLTVGPGVFEL